jgi:hypothetical protein
MGSIERFLAHAGVAWCCFSTLARAEAPARADSPSRAQCLAQHERAQDARLVGHLLDARAALRECSAATCPPLVSKDCVAWLTDVEQQIPSVIFSGAKDGEDVVAVSVRDGERLLTESITGSPLELDPGPHRFRAELAGFPAQEATYVLQAGDKARVVRFEFVSERRAGPVASATLPSQPSAPQPVLWRPIPTVSYALGGASLVAVVTGSVLGTVALSKRKELERRCAPLCGDRAVNEAKNLALGADIAFAVALLGAGGAIYSYAARPSVPLREDANLRVSWTGMGFAAEGAF